MTNSPYPRYYTLCNVCQLDNRHNKGLTRSVELTTPGQQIQYIPPGGGVRTYVVDAVLQQPGRLSFVLRTTSEQMGKYSGYQEQHFATDQFDFQLTSDGLAARHVTRSSNQLGDNDLSISGAGEVVGEGILQKVNGGGD